MAYRRPSSKVQFKVEEEGAGRERNGRTALPSGQERALPRPKPLPMTVRGRDSWCSVHQCSSPTTPGRVKGLVIVIVIVMCMHSSVCEYLKEVSLFKKKKKKDCTSCLSHVSFVQKTNIRGKISKGISPHKRLLLKISVNFF